MKDIIHTAADRRLDPEIHDAVSARAVLCALNAPAHPLVEWASEELFWYECGMSSLERVEDAVTRAVASVRSGRAVH